MGQQRGWFRASILCALSVIALTACSGSSPLVASPSSSTGPGDKPAAVALADARRSIVEDLAAPLNVSLKSAHFSIESTFESGGGRAVWTTDGVADLVGDRFGGTISGSATGSQATSIRFLDVGSTQYTTDGPGKSWRAAALVADQLPLTKPEVYLVGHIQDTGRPSYTDDLELKKHIVDTFITGLASKGTELLHGSWAFHYDVALDGEHLDGKLPAAVVQELQAWDEAPSPGHIDVWIDQAGRLRKMVQTGSEQDSGMTFTGSNTYELWDYGMPVSIEVPKDLPSPPGQIIIPTAGPTDVRSTAP